MLTLVSSVPTITFVTNNNVNFAFASDSSSDDNGGSSSDDNGGSSTTIAVVAVATITVVLRQPHQLLTAVSILHQPQ